MDTSDTPNQFNVRKYAQLVLGNQRLNLTISVSYVLKERSLLYFIPLLDLDECQNYPNYCHKLATCTNERGSYDCKCKAGYVGDGFDCHHYAGEMC